MQACAAFEGRVVPGRCTNLNDEIDLNTVEAIHKTNIWSFVLKIFHGSCNHNLVTTNVLVGIFLR